MHTTAESIQGCSVGVSCYFNLIGFLNAIPRVRQLIRQITVVGDQNQAFTCHVQAPYGKHSLLPGDKINDTGPTRRVKMGRYHTSWFVDQMIRACLVKHGFAVDLQRLSLQIHFGSQQRYHFVVDSYSSGSDQLFTCSATAESGIGKYLLQTHC